MAKTKPYQFSIGLSDKYTSDQREAIAAEVISFVRQRTLSGKDVDGKSFASYSKSYVNSVNFKATGKGRKPNLQLSGDMLAYMEVVANKKGEVVLGYGDSNPQAGKAEGNNLGTYGQSKPIAGKAREFLGIRDEDLARILRKYPVKDEARREARADAVLKAQEKIDEFVNSVQEEGELDEFSPSELKSEFKLKIGKG